MLRARRIVVGFACEVGLNARLMEMLENRVFAFLFLGIGDCSDCVTRILGGRCSVLLEVY